MSIEPQSKKGYYLQGVTQRLYQVLPKKLHDHMDAWMTEITPVTGAKSYGSGGMTLYWMKYTAVFDFERFPFTEFDPQVLFANVMAWLYDHDLYRDDHGLDSPTFDNEAETDRTSTVSIEIEFIEPVDIVLDPQGVIDYMGQKWTLAPHKEWAAEHGDIAVGRH